MTVLVLGILFVVAAIVLNATSQQKVPFLSNVLVKFSTFMIMGGLGTALCFASWVEVTVSTLKVRVITLLFNYVPTLLILGGGVIELVGNWLGDGNIALNGLRLHIAGYIVLMLKLGYGFRYLNKLTQSLNSDK
jgi:uncharacterized membrane protein